MSVFGTNSVQHAAGLNQVEKAIARNADAKKAAKPDARKRPQDEVDIDVQTTQAEDAIRNLKSNTEEETAEDRTSHDHYKSNDPAKKRPRLDVQG